MNQSPEGKPTGFGGLLRDHQGISPDDSIRDTKPILEDSIRGALRQMSDEELRAASVWSNSWTQDHVSAVKRWVARGPIQDEIERRQRMLRDAPSDAFSRALDAPRTRFIGLDGSE